MRTVCYHFRQIASVYVWVRVTSGEPWFAPRPIQATQPPEIQEDWRRSWDRIWQTLLHSSQPRSYHTRLRAGLDALAATLASTFDTTWATNLIPSGDRKPLVMCGDGLDGEAALRRV